VVWPIGADVAAVSVNVLFVPDGLGAKDGVIPLGGLGTEKVTLPLNPFRSLTVIVLVALAP
jgi:hypothetical protein